MSAHEDEVKTVIEAILSEEVVTGAMLTVYLQSTGLKRGQQAKLLGLSPFQLRRLEAGIHNPSARTLANVRYLIAHPEEIESVLGLPSKLVPPVTQPAPKNIPIGLIPSTNGYWGFCVAADCRKRVYFTNTRQKYCSRACSQRVNKGTTSEIDKPRRPSRNALFRKTLVRCPHCGTEFGTRGNFIGYGPAPAEGQAHHDQPLQVDGEEPGVSETVLRLTPGSLQPDFAVRVLQSDTDNRLIPVPGSEGPGSVAVHEAGRLEYPEGRGGRPDSE